MTRAQSELEELLVEQVNALVSSSAAFDAGNHFEAKRIGTVVRVLLHETANSRSLLGQLRWRSGPWWDTAVPMDPRNLWGSVSLAFVEIRTGVSASWVPRLNDLPPPDVPAWSAIDPWWNAVVLADKEGVTFTRKDLVTVLVNAEGGAHVDPRGDAKFRALKRDKWRIDWRWEPLDGSTPVEGVVCPNPALASMRQLAHEVLTTLYHRIPWLAGGARVYNVSRPVLPTAPPAPGQRGRLYLTMPPVPAVAGISYNSSLLWRGRGQVQLRRHYYDEHGVELPPTESTHG